jgi:hypothetical protein
VHPGKLGVVLATESAPKALAERYRLDRRLSSRSGDDGWPPLPGTRVEVEWLRRLFAAEPKPLLLLDSEASEQKLDALAAAGNSMPWLRRDRNSMPWLLVLATTT